MSNRSSGKSAKLDLGDEPTANEGVSSLTREAPTVVCWTGLDDGIVWCNAVPAGAPAAAAAAAMAAAAAGVDIVCTCDILLPRASWPPSILTVAADDTGATVAGESTLTFGCGCTVDGNGYATG